MSSSPLSSTGCAQRLPHADMVLVEDRSCALRQAALRKRSSITLAPACFPGAAER